MSLGTGFARFMLLDIFLSTRRLRYAARFCLSGAEANFVHTLMPQSQFLRPTHALAQYLALVTRAVTRMHAAVVSLGLGGHVVH